MIKDKSKDSIFVAGSEEFVIDVYDANTPRLIHLYDG
jgi:hypothetical protein